MNWTIREGRVDEVDRLVALRRAMFEGMGYDDPEVLDRVSDASRRYFAEQIPAGVLRVWVACASGANCVGTGGGASSDEIGTCGGKPAASTGLADCVSTDVETRSDKIGTCEGEQTASIGLADAVGGAEGRPIASVGLVIHSVPPGPSNLAGTEGYVMNLVTLPAWQRRGIARVLLAHVLDVLRAEGVPVVSLHATSDGHELYEDLGFTVRGGLPEMRLHI